MIEATALILPDLGLNAPSFDLSHCEWDHLRKLDLADPNYRVPNLKRGSAEDPTAQRTRLGWLVFGPTGPTGRDQGDTVLSNVLQPLFDLDQTLRRFWELEEPSKKKMRSPEDSTVERLFRAGIRRDTSGRYIVRLPFKNARPTNLSGTLGAARSALLRTQKRMKQDKKWADAYNKFMQDYEAMGHVRRIPPAKAATGEHCCYLPHHGIWQRSDLGEKLRVVFNASCKPRFGPTLNDHLYVGPELLLSIMMVLSIMRLYRIVFGADIRHMYRRVLVDERDIDFQRILWMDPTDGSELLFWLITLTYGTACAPYLAQRVLLQLVHDEGRRFPAAAKIIKTARYMDDLYGGADDLDEAKRVRDELIQLLAAGGFPLSKWLSNCPALIEDIPTTDVLRPWKSFHDDQPVKTLGMAWDPVKDEFCYQRSTGKDTDPITKRSILAELAKLFDPMGWVSPILIVAKILMQDLWRNKLDWDDRLPRELTERWEEFSRNLNQISDIRIPRWLGTRTADKVSLHGFADASQKAYAACVYMRAGNQEEAQVHLVASKTRVAPVKFQTIPRLELCATALLADLLQQVTSWISERVIDTLAWTDSSIALAWLEADPTRWPTFIANRIAHVQKTLPGMKWRYVPSEENPADLASRGVSPSQLAHSELWWRGPPWLRRPPTYWPKPLLCNQLNLEGTQPREDSPVEPTPREEVDWARRFSSLTNLVRTIARCRRWIRTVRPAMGSVTEPLKIKEIDEAIKISIRQAQSRMFQDEIQALRSNRSVGKRSPLRNLNPFLDPKGVMRVGGRLEQVALPYELRHPPILPKKCWLANLIIDRAHKTALHEGPTLTYAYAIKNAWIVGGRGRCRSHVRRCVQCAKIKAKPQQQIMGDLPAVRITRGEVFGKVGLDYAGPFFLKAVKGRGVRTTKGYLAIFVCLSTKAVHLEVVGDLTTASFLAALRRFTARRGRPKEIWSDNATTFHGANKELKAMFRESNLNWPGISTAMANDGIQWRFIPPKAPHFGGLWEAAVKSAKSHLKRVVGEQHLTYEEFTTQASLVESCLNSRPLIPISGDIEDLQVLTPGHFLTNSQITWPDEHNEPATLKGLNHWRLISAMRNHFWTRWSREYLHTLQQRNKWQEPRDNLKVNDLVLVLDPALITRGSWPLGRIEQEHPGRTGQTRVVTVRTSSGLYTRPITKLCRLPVERDNG